jgi:hypothetical protein
MSMQFYSEKRNWFCYADDGIRIVRVRGVKRTVGTQGDGWEIQVRRPPARRVLRHVVRTLKEAKAWALQHWRPWFLDELASTLPRTSPAHSLLGGAAHVIP